MINKVHIQNYKNIQDQAIDFDRLTVFVGPNGCGKTSVLEAIDLAVHADPNNGGWAYSKNKEWGWIYAKGGSGDLSIECETPDGSFNVQATPPDRFLLPPDPLGERGWDVRSNCSSTSLSSDVIVRGSILPLVFFHFNKSKLAEASYSEALRPQLDPDGGGLASVLAFMALNKPDAFQEFMVHLRELFPKLTRIRFRKAPVSRTEVESVVIGTDSGERRTTRTFQGEAMLFDFKNATDVAAHTVSEGTLMIVGLLTALLGPYRYKTVLLDDVDHGLHPLAQSELLKLIKKLMQRFPELQILATTHSPYLLDHLEPQEIRLMTTDSNGHAICGRLNDHPEFERWKEEMAPGEMWSYFGEKWLLDKEGEVR